MDKFLGELTGDEVGPNPDPEDDDANFFEDLQRSEDFEDPYSQTQKLIDAEGD